jgi:quercetin dioxygenase-like cupin family protein
MRVLNDLPRRPIEAHGSRNASASILGRGDAHVVRIELGPDGLLGLHPASVPQLFVVIEGSGWVRTEHGEDEPVVAGTVVHWDAGESHETRTEQGLVALVVEAEEIAPG